VLSDYIPILIILILSILLVGVLLSVSYLLGPRRNVGRKLTPYECGVPSLGDARERFASKYYLIAALFILFDVEIVFLFAWAVVFKKLGLFAFIEIVAFFYCYPKWLFLCFEEGGA